MRSARPAPDRRVVACGIAVALLLTAIELALFGAAMRREIVRAGQAPPDRVLEVDLIAEERPIEIPPEPVPPPRSRAPVEAQRARVRVAPREAARRSHPESTTPARIPRLVGLDGHILIPDETAANDRGEPKALAGDVASGDAFARANPVPYEPTRFDAYFPDVRETLGGEILRKTTLTYTWLTPWGTQWTCKTNLLLLGMGGCGWGPAPRLTAEQLKAIRAPDLPLPRLPQPPPPSDASPLLSQPPADDAPAVFDVQPIVPDTNPR